MQNIKGKYNNRNYSPSFKLVEEKKMENTNKIARRNINNSDVQMNDFNGRKWRGIKNLLMKVKEKSEKVGSKLNIQKTKIMASSPITSWQRDKGKVITVADFIFLGSKITADSDWSHEIKMPAPWKKAITNLNSALKSRDITLLTKVCIVKAMVFPVVMYGCESWIIKKAECWRTDAFNLWCWKRLLRVP